MTETRIALVGLGKISVDQHIPAIKDNPAFQLAGGVSPRSRVPGVRGFPDIDELLATADVDAVAINTPPQVRFKLARQALLAGKHVLLEKPPCATLSELAALQRIASDARLSLYAGWHSQHAPAVAPARRWLSGKEIRRVAVTWCEDVREWHPGQKWIWQPGGLGVFDPGVNALSILTAVLTGEMFIEQAAFKVPGNCHTPVAAELLGRVGDDGQLSVTLDFLHGGAPTWSISIVTDHGTLEIEGGGAALSINGATQPIGASQEYASIYRRFAELLNDQTLEVDSSPLRLVADAFLVAERTQVENFVE